MAGLQRSAVSFRRQGSSGLVWDDRFFSGELKQTRRHDQDRDDAGFRELRSCRSVGSVPAFHRNRSTTAHRLAVIISPSPPAINGDPPSPRLTGCGFCGVFGRHGVARQQKPNKRRSKAWIIKRKEKNRRTE